MAYIKRIPWKPPQYVEISLVFSLFLTPKLLGKDFNNKMCGTILWWTSSELPPKPPGWISSAPHCARELARFKRSLEVSLSVYCTVVCCIGFVWLCFFFGYLFWHVFKLLYFHASFSILKILIVQLRMILTNRDWHMRGDSYTLFCIQRGGALSQPMLLLLANTNRGRPSQLTFCKVMPNQLQKFCRKHLSLSSQTTNKWECISLDSFLNKCSIR